MAATLTQAVDAVADKLDAITDLAVSAYQADSINPPHAIIYPTGVQYHGAMQTGDVRYILVVDVLVSTTMDHAAAEALHELVSPTGTRSIRATLANDLTLGAVVRTSHVADAAEFRPVNIGELTYYAASFNLTVYA